VRDAVVAHGGDRDAGRAQARGVCLALVAQHVGLVDDHQRRRKPASISSPARSGDANGSLRRSTSGQ
jgi:hypothetical protein